MLKFNLLTIFPDIFDSYFNESIIGRAKKNKKIKINIHNIRDYAKDKNKTVDDRPYGGGPGMILKIEPIFEALKNVVGKKELQNRFKKRIGQTRSKTRIIITDPDGKLFNQADAKRLTKYENVVIITGHYEAVDARVEKMCDEKISIGNYIITGGELAAMVIVDSVARLLPGVLGNPGSIEESLNYNSARTVQKKFDYPHYTRPEVFSPDGKIEWKAPKVLLSGDHKKILEWREKFICQ